MTRLSLCLSLFIATFAFAATPKLGVLIVVDQLSADQFDKRLVTAKAGIKQLATKGLRFKEMRYETAPTLTAEGHSTLVTGAYPELHGVVSNGWFDSAANAHRNAGEDPRYWMLHRAFKAGDPTAPTAQRVSSLSEAIKSRHPDAKVVSVASKGRSALMMGGGAADIALWFDAKGTQPQFTTSSYYADRVPEFLKPLNDKLPALLAGSRTSAGHLSVEEFPELQPILDASAAEVAISAIDAYGLGQDDVPDLLFLSFSGHDEVAHEKGPDSPELERQFAVVDAEIAKVLAALDAKVGNYVVALVADHGGNQVPDLLSMRRIMAGRIDTTAVLAALEKEADGALGPSDYFRGYWMPGFHANPGQLQKLESIYPRLREIARAQPGVFDLLSMRAVMSGEDNGPLTALYRRGYQAGRSPDFMLLPRPYWHYGTKDNAAHGTPWQYDRAVPLIFFGKSIKAGMATTTATAADVAPTLAALLNIPPPAAATGLPLREVLSSSSK